METCNKIFQFMDQIVFITTFFSEGWTERKSIWMPYNTVIFSVTLFLFDDSSSNWTKKIARFKHWKLFLNVNAKFFFFSFFFMSSSGIKSKKPQIHSWIRIKVRNKNISVIFSFLRMIYCPCKKSLLKDKDITRDFWTLPTPTSPTQGGLSKF